MIGNRSNTKNIVIIILIVFILALGGLSAYLIFFKEEKIVDCKEPKTDDKKDDVIQNKIEIYGKKYETGDYFICNHKSDSDDCKNILYTIKTDSSNASVIHVNLDKEYIIFYDDGVKIYNTKDESVNKLDVDMNGNIEWLEEGFIYNGKDSAYYYDLKLNKKTLDKYDEIYPVEELYSDNNGDPKYLKAKKGDSSLLIDFKTGNVLITLSNKDYEAIDFEKADSYIIVSFHGVENITKIIYNSKGEKKVELEDNQTFEINGSKITIYEQSLKKVKDY